MPRGGRCADHPRLAEAIFAALPKSAAHQCLLPALGRQLVISRNRGGPGNAERVSDRFPLLWANRRLRADSRLPPATGLPREDARKVPWRAARWRALSPDSRGATALPKARRVPADNLGPLRSLWSINLGLQRIR